MQTLEDLDLVDNTLLIFASDNGGNPKDFTGTANVNLNLASEAGEIRKKFKTARVDARKLGHYVNGDWRDGKGHPYEGGHRVPFIVRWPGHVEPNTTSDYLFNLTDMLATFADVTGGELPDEAGVDSISMLPVLLGEEPTGEREAIFVLGDGKNNAVAVCTGQWKLIDYKQTGDRELYDLFKDRGETTDVASEHPEIVERLSAALAKARSDGRTRPVGSLTGS